MTVPAALLSVRDLAVTYEGEERAAPAGVSLDVAPGEVVLLLGPSGSGKSTLTLALNGLIPQAIPAETAGAVEVGGEDAATTPVAALSAHVAMVFQDPDAQLVTGTVLDEVAFGPENLLLPVDEVLRRAEDALRRVGLWERRAENPDRLSGGGRQRLAIAAALAMGAPLVVLDEPTANLDPRGTEEVYAALADVVAAGDRAIVLVEHNLDAAVGFVSRVVVLDAGGRVLADGTVDAVLRERAEELHELGVWLPTSALAALRLRRAGFALDPLPLDPAELHAALEAAPAPARATEGIVVREDASAPRLLPKADAPSVGDVIVEVRGLTLRRGHATVLEDVDLEIRRGEFVAVVGANGAGKTSLVQAIAGVVRPPRGAVRVAGRDVARTDARTLAGTVGFVFQNPEHQFVAHSVRGELAYGRHGAVDDARIDEILARFGLADRADVHPFLLSGGQKRRLSVGTALVGGAPILVLDEPTFGQDRARADELLQLLRDLNAEGTTVVVVTHDMQLVAEYADRAIVLRDGRVLADGPTAAAFADDALVAEAGLRPPPLRAALRGLTRHPSLARAARLADLPGAGA